MTDLKNDRLLRALCRETVDATPVWLMRQAGRYLPEYRAKRAAAGDFLSLCQNPELACEITLQPLQRFDLDAAILFSDILTIPDALGLGLYFEDGEGPRFRAPLRDVAAIERLGIVNTARDLPYVLDAVKLIRRELNGRVPLIGFSGSPWTLATYMIEGGSSRDFIRAKSLLYAQPGALHLLLEKLAASVVDYLNAQIAAGAQVVQIFDTWGGALSAAAYREFSLRYMIEIVCNLIRTVDGRRVPVILFTKGGSLWLEDLADSGCDALGLDWCVDIGVARNRVGARVALQGNLDPAVLRAPEEVVRAEIEKVLRAFGSAPGHVFNLGHGISPDIEPSRVALLVDTVHSISAKLRQAER